MTELALFSAQIQEDNPTEAVIKVSGELDVATVPVLSDRLAEVLSERPRKLVFDFSELSFMDCSGVSVVAHARRNLGQDCQVVLRQPNRTVRQLLQLTGMDGPCVIDD
jgi:anti-anti-sigma factor